MFIRITEGTVAAKKCRVKGEIVELDDKDGQFLINLKKAELAVDGDDMTFDDLSENRTKGNLIQFAQQEGISLEGCTNNEKRFSAIEEEMIKRLDDE